MRVRLRLVIVLAAFAAPGGAQGGGERDQVLAAVQSFLDAIASRDVEMARRAMLPDGMLVSTRDENGSAVIRSQSHQEFFASLQKGTGRQVERIWNPDVKVHGAMAVVWAPYDFHRDGRFSHCGVDVFSLVRASDGWKVAGAVYTIERTGCAPSPLGPLGRGVKEQAVPERPTAPLPVEPPGQLP